MNLQKGLLAFLCAAIASACALLQIPVVSGMEQLLGDASLPVEPVTAQSLRKDQRPDPEIESLSKAHNLPFWTLKAHLAITSKGVRGTGGLFWSRLPRGDEQLPNDGLQRTRAAAALLGKLQAETGSTEGALLAWQVGSYRARRAVEADDNLSAALRLHLLASHRDDAKRFLCTVSILARALDARSETPGVGLCPDWQAMDPVVLKPEGEEEP